MEVLSTPNHPAFSALKSRRSAPPRRRNTWTCSRYVCEQKFPTVLFLYWLIDPSGVCRCSNPAAETDKHTSPIECEGGSRTIPLREEARQSISAQLSHEHWKRLCRAVYTDALAANAKDNAGPARKHVALHR